MAGATPEKDLPVGKHPLKLYSLATPNGVKLTVMLEELLAQGHMGTEYDAWLIRIIEVSLAPCALSGQQRITAVQTRRKLCSVT